MVGVARDSKFNSLDEKPRPSLYLPVFQEFVLRVEFPRAHCRRPSAAYPRRRSRHPCGGPGGARLWPAQSRGLHQHRLFRQRLGGSLLGVFGGLALLLAAVGLYGVLAYSVTQRSREVGIRIALGADRTAVLRLILGQGMRLAAVGLAIGLAASLAVTRLMTALLFAVSPTDVPTFVIVSVLLAAVAFAASFIPAWRAARIDPIVAMRHT